MITKEFIVLGATTFFIIMGIISFYLFTKRAKECGLVSSNQSSTNNNQQTKPPIRVGSS